MAQLTVKNAAGSDAGTVVLDDALFAMAPNIPLMHQVVTAQLARRRAGTQSTKTRSEVRGGGAKPYRQKGTGNARQGSTNSPHYTGGGIAHGPKPRSYGQRTPKKMIRLALRSALSDRAAAGKVLVVDGWSFASPKTKEASASLAALGVDGRVLLVVERDNTNAALSFRNLPEVQLIHPGELNAYDVLCNDWIVFTQASLALIPTPGLDKPVTDSKAELTDATESVTASAPDRSDDDMEAGVASASEQPDASESEPADTVTASAPDRSDDDMEAGVASASEQPDASESEQAT